MKLFVAEQIDFTDMSNEKDDQSLHGLPTTNLIQEFDYASLFIRKFVVFLDTLFVQRRGSKVEKFHFNKIPKWNFMELLSAIPPPFIAACRYIHAL